MLCSLLPIAAFGRGLVRRFRPLAPGGILLAIPVLLSLVTLLVLLGHSVPVAAETIGGTDVPLLSYDAVAHQNPAGRMIDIASDGTIFAAVNTQSTADGLRVLVYRSQNGGKSWSVWGSLSEPGHTAWNQGYICRTLDVVEGAVDRVYLACSYIAPAFASYQAQVIYSDLAASSASWSTTTVHSTPTETFRKEPLDLVTDVDDFSGFYVYVLLQERASGFSLWFTRSTDQGATFANVYLIAQAPDANRRFWFADLDYGFGGYLHCSYVETEYIGGSGRVLHRRAGNYAGQGSASWETPRAVTPFAPIGATYIDPTVAASRTDASVVIGYWKSDGSSSSTRLSTDQGLSWPAGAAKTHAPGPISVTALSDGFAAASFLDDGRVVVERSTTANPLTWGPLNVLSDFPDPNPRGGVHVVADPTRGNRLAALWTSQVPFAVPDESRFDAEWHGDVGYPNVKPGFPLDLPRTPTSAPILANMDGDPQLEILFTSAGGIIEAYDHDGVPLQGWPVNVGAAFDAGVAVADLDEDGSPEVAVGTTLGEVYLFRADGSLAPGWPVQLINAPAYVSIGTITRLARRDIVVCAGVWTYILRFDGQIRRSYNALSGTTAVGPPALADLNGDGHDEIIVGLTTRVGIFDYVQDRLVRARSFGSGKTVSGAPSVGDLDLDGDLEIVTPTGQGDVYVFDGVTMVDHPGWPFSDPTAGPISSVALAQLLGNGELELAFTGRDQVAHLRFQDGSSASGWPHATGAGWFVYAMPIVETIDEGSPDVIVGSRDQKGYAWKNLTSEVPGWPVDLADKVNQTAASGDIDADGDIEIVFLTDTTLEVVEVQAAVSTLGEDRRWPMAGHDAQRTGCQGCVRDLATAVEGDDTGPTTIAFHAPYPNPAPGGAYFRYELPTTAAVELTLYDLRGRRVRTLVDSRQEAGAHRAFWDGKDERNQRVAQGNYYARLRVDGSEGTTQTRTLTLKR